MGLRLISVMLLALPLAMVTPANELIAQTTTSGGLTGVVTDPKQAVVPDAGVEIKDDAKGTIQSTKTDRAGVYRFFFLAPEKYTLTVTHTGFRSESRTANVLLGRFGSRSGVELQPECYFHAQPRGPAQCVDQHHR